MSPKIFISYRRVDTSAEAGRIYDYLENQLGKGSVFKDVDTISIGDNIQKRIYEAIKQCQIFLILIGRDWVEARDKHGNPRLKNPTDWIRYEIETAFTLNIRVIPVLLNDAVMPSSTELPESLRFLTLISAACVRHNPDFKRDMERMTIVIHKVLEASALKGKLERIMTMPPEELLLTMTPLELINRGKKDFNTKKYKDSIEKYSIALRIDANNAVAYAERGKAWTKLGNKQKAIDDYDKALRIFPNYSEACNDRGKLRYELGDISGALEDLGVAIHLSAEKPEAYENRGNVKHVVGDYWGAIADYDKALYLESNNIPVFNNRGLTKHNLKQYKSALEDYETAERKCSLLPAQSAAIIYRNIGLSFYALSDRINAASNFDMARMMYEIAKNNKEAKLMNKLIELTREKDRIDRKNQNFINRMTPLLKKSSSLIEQAFPNIGTCGDGLIFKQP